MNKEIIKIIDEGGNDKMLWETIGKPAYEKGLRDGRNESPLFAVIPVTILENKNLSANAKLLYGEICALSKKSGKCYATNEYLGKMLGLSERSMPQLLKELSGNGLVIVDIKRNKKGTYRDIMVSFFSGGGYRSITSRGIVKERGQIRNRQIEIDKVDNKIANLGNSPIKPLKELFNEKIPLKEDETPIRDEFLDYWTEKNDGGKKERWQMQKVFDVRRRWATWLKKREDFKGFSEQKVAVYDLRKK